VDCLLDSSDPRELGEAVGRAIAWGARPAATQLLDAVLDQRRDEIVRVLSDAIAGHALDEGVEYLYRDRPVYLRSVRRVVSIARMIASAMAVGDEAGRHVEQAALLHDLGRLVLLDLVLDDGQPCTSGESALTRARFTWTAATLDLIPQLAPAARAIASVRERVDGSGEPNGMRGNEIPIGSRILAVAVAFDSISAAWSGSPDDAIAQANAELVRGSGHLFDPLVVRAWLRALDRFGSILREVN
jgi:response regulator RpfG family c-di-GMP phosphodiesterase